MKNSEDVSRMKHTLNFFKEIPYVLPCKYCRESFIKFSKEMPVTDYSFDEIHKHSLSVAPPRTGVGAFTQSDDMVKLQRHDRMFDISLSILGDY